MLWFIVICSFWNCPVQRIYYLWSRLMGSTSLRIMINCSLLTCYFGWFSNSLHSSFHLTWSIIRSVCCFFTFCCCLAITTLCNALVCDQMCEVSMAYPDNRPVAYCVCSVGYTTVKLRDNTRCAGLYDYNVLRKPQNVTFWFNMSPFTHKSMQVSRCI